jgi:DNA-binding NarL/FixJ family response regulator
LSFSLDLLIPLNPEDPVNQQLPDIILLDIRMPDINGYEVCTRLKAAHLGLRGKWYSIDTIIGDMVGL